MIFVISFMSCKKDDGNKIPAFGNEKTSTYVSVYCGSCKIDKVVSGKVKSSYYPNGQQIQINIEDNANTQLNITYDSDLDKLCVYDFVINNVPVIISNGGCGRAPTMKFK